MQGADLINRVWWSTKINLLQQTLARVSASLCWKVAPHCHFLSVGTDMTQVGCGAWGRSACVGPCPWMQRSWRWFRQRRAELRIWMHRIFGGRGREGWCQVAGHEAGSSAESPRPLRLALRGPPKHGDWGSRPGLHLPSPPPGMALDWGHGCVWWCTFN